MFFDSFSGAASDLPKANREPRHLIRCLAAHPRISTWDMCEHSSWLPSLVDQCKRAGFIKEIDEPYPWLRFEVLPAGYAALADAVKPS